MLDEYQNITESVEQEVVLNQKNEQEVKLEKQSETSTEDIKTENKEVSQNESKESETDIKEKEGKRHTKAQLAEIIAGMRHGVDIRQYDNPRLKANQMREIRYALEKGNSLKEFISPSVSAEYIKEVRLAIVNEFVKKKLIYENDKKSCVFVGYDNEEKERYASIRSTSTATNAFKGEAESSDKRFGFARRGSNHILTIMEAPIDLLSYMTLYKIHGLEKLIENDHLLSLGGVCDNALKQYLYDHPEITTIKIGLDNDKVGNEASLGIIQEYSSQYQVKRLRIKGKDFNEMLIQDVNEQIAAMQIKRMEEIKQQVDEEENQLELA